MQVSILNGTYSKGSDYRTSYPVNYVPVPKQTGLSAGYLKPAEGFNEISVLTDRPRGSYLYNGDAYFVAGRHVVKLNTDYVLSDYFQESAWKPADYTSPRSKRTVSTLPDRVDINYVEDDGLPVSFCHSFDRLCVASGGKLYYITNDTVAEVTDPDIGTVNDVVYLDGYYLVTDGTYIIATKLNDPTSVNPLSYASSEIDPDPIQRLLVNRNELYAVNRYTIEVFTNAGTSPFPFARITGAHIQKGALGRWAACVFVEAIAFVGSGHNEAPAVYIGENAQTIKISTREIDQILASYSEKEQSTIQLEQRITDGHKFLYVHLPDKTLVYDAAATLVMQEPVWHILTTALDGFGQYMGRYFLWFDGKWICTDTIGKTRDSVWSYTICEVTSDHGKHLDLPVRWEFGTQITRSDTGGAVIHQIELIGINGQVEFGTAPQISASYTSDGEMWSQDRWINVGKAGERIKRLVWWRQGMLNDWRAYRFRGTSDARLAVSRLEIGAETLIP